MQLKITFLSVAGLFILPLYAAYAQSEDLKPAMRREYAALPLPDGSTDFVPKSKFSADTLQGLQLVVTQKITEGI